MGYDEERQQLYFNYIETGRSKQWAEQTLDDSWRLYYNDTTGMISGKNYRDYPKNIYDLTQLRPNIK